MSAAKSHAAGNEVSVSVTAGMNCMLSRFPINDWALVAAVLSFAMVPLFGPDFSFLFGGSAVALSVLSSVFRTSDPNDREHSIYLRAGALVLIVTFPVLLSAFVNQSNVAWKAGISFAAMQTAAAMVAISRSVKSLLSFLTICTWTLTPILLYILIFGQYSGYHGRLAGVPGIEIHPNYISLIAVTLAACSVSQGLKTAIVINFFVGAIVYLCQSRTAMVCIIECLGVLSLSALPRGASLNRRELTGLLLVLVSCFVTVGAIVWNFDYINENFLRLNDSSRGLQSGFSGRDTVWDDLIKIWKRNPVAGAGYMAVRNDLNVETDGGYFLVAAETGILGLASIGIVFGAFFFSIIAVRGVSPQIRLFWWGMLVAFPTMNILEARLQSAANPFTFLFYVSAYSAVGVATAGRNAQWESETYVVWSSDQSSGVSDVSS